MNCEKSGIEGDQMGGQAGNRGLFRVVVAVAGHGNDHIFADDRIDLASLASFAGFGGSEGSGQKGDWLSGDWGNDSLFVRRAA